MRHGMGPGHQRAAHAPAHEALVCVDVTVDRPNDRGGHARQEDGQQVGHPLWKEGQGREMP